MQRRIFIAINLDDKTKKFIDNKLTAWKEELPIRWTAMENLHITLQFIGYIDDEQTEEIVGRLNEILQDIEAFDISLNLIEWGPSAEKPKMLWLKGEKNQQLIELRNLVENAVMDYAIEMKEFRPHVTLGRLVRGKQRKDLPDIKKETNILVPVVSVDVMESVVEKGRRKYLVMERIELA